MSECPIGSEDSGKHKAPVRLKVLVEGTSWGMPSEQLRLRAGASTHERVRRRTHHSVRFGRSGTSSEREGCYRRTPISVSHTGRSDCSKHSNCWTADSPTATQFSVDKPVRSRRKTAARMSNQRRRLGCKQPRKAAMPFVPEGMGHSRFVSLNPPIVPASCVSVAFSCCRLSCRP